ncbi:MAG: hypothetical protein ACP5PR_02555 [Minisyncoccia bacterium]
MAKEQLNYPNEDKDNELEVKKEKIFAVSPEERRFIEEELSKKKEIKSVIPAVLSFLIFKNGKDLTVEEYLNSRDKFKWFKEFEKDLTNNPKYNQINFDELTKQKCRDLLNEYKESHPSDFNEKLENK